MSKQSKKQVKTPAQGTKVVNNLMTGKPVTIPADTPLCCDPSSETYWCS